MGRMTGVNRTWTRLEKRHASLLSEALLRLTPLEEILPTNKHSGCSLGTLAQPLLLGMNKKNMERRKKTSPFVFQEGQKGAKGGKCSDNQAQLSKTETKKI